MSENSYSKNNFRDFFEGVWKEIGKTQQRDFLKNEGELQCVLYSKIIKKIKTWGLSCWVEPTLLLQNKKGKKFKLKPDMLILEKPDVVKCIIELKFTTPYVAFEYDWIKFYQIHTFNPKLSDQKLNLEKLDWFIFAYVDNGIGDNGVCDSAVGTREKVKTFLDKGKPSGGEDCWRPRFNDADLPDLKWLKGIYIHAHGELNRNDWEIYVFDKKENL